MTKRIIRRFQTSDIFVEIQDCTQDEKPRVFHFPHHTVFCLRQAPEDLPIDVRYGSKRVTRGGRLSIVPANVSLRAQFIGRHRTALVGIDEAYLDSRGFMNSTALKARIEECSDIGDSTIEFYLRQMVIEAGAPSSTTPDLLYSLASAVMLTLSRYFAGNLPREVPRGELQIELIRNHIEANTVDCRIADLAALSGMSARHFARLFSSLTGMTVHRYVWSVKLAMAERLLTETDWPVKDIAYKLGFAHPSTFATTFLTHTGRSPTAARLASKSAGSASLAAPN